MLSKPQQPAPSYLGTKTQSLSDRLLWIWSNQRLRVQRGMEHGKDITWEGANVEHCYRGWFDPATHELFIVSPVPVPSTRPNAASLRGIPRILDHVLHRRFGDQFTYRLF